MKLNKKTLAALLAVVVVFCALPMGAAAANHDHSPYTELTSIDPAVPLTTGQYYLTQDIDVRDGSGELAELKITSDTVIDLNGCKLNYKKLTVNTTNFVLQNCGSAVTVGPMEIKGGAYVDGNISITKGSEAAAVVVSAGSEGIMLNPENGGTVSVDGISANGRVLLDYASSCGAVKATGANFFLTIFDDYSGSAPIAFTPYGEGFFCALSKDGDVEDYIDLQSDVYIIKEEEDALPGVRDLTLVKKPTLTVVAAAQGSCFGSLEASNGVSSCTTGGSIPYTGSDTIKLTAAPGAGSIFVGWEFPEAPGTYRTDSEYPGSEFGGADVTVKGVFVPKLEVKDVLTQVGKEAEFTEAWLGFTNEVWTPASGAPEGSGTSTYTIPAANITEPGTYTYTLDADCADFTAPFTYDYEPVEFKLYVNGITDEGATEFELGAVAPDAAVAFGTPVFSYSKDGTTFSDTAPDSVGTWTVKVTVAEDAANNVPALEETYDITVNFPKPTVSADPETVTLASNAGSTKLTAVSTMTGVEYQWKGDGIAIAGATTAEYTVNYTDADLGEHKYTCVVTLGSDSAESDEITVTVKNVNTVEVSIADWTYGGTPAAPAATATYNAAGATFSYSASETGTYSATVPTNAGDYYVKASVPAGEFYDAAESAPKKFTINKADQNPPLVTVKNESVKTLKDGAIEGVTSAMEYRLSSDSTWTACPNGKIENLAPGSYEVRYKATENYNAGAPAPVIVAEGGQIPADAMYRFTYTPLTKLPDELKSTFATLADLQTDMLNKVKTNKMGGKSPTGYQLWDIVLQFSLDKGATWHTVTGEIFPTQGFLITLPYPNGTSSTASKFYCGHIFTYGTKCGAYEYPDVTTDTNGVQMKLTGTSPLLLAYEGSGSSGNNTGNGGTGTAVSTGDTNNPLFWAVLLGVSALGLGATIVIPKLRKKQQEKND